MKTIALLLVVVLTGCCEEPKIVYVHDTVELWRDKYITPPEELVRPVNIVILPQPLTTIDLKMGFQEQRESSKLCNGQLSAIKTLGEPQ